MSLFTTSLCTWDLSKEIANHSLGHLMVVYDKSYKLVIKFLFQTAYLKLVDIWLFFGLVLPFFAFVLKVVEEICENKEESEQKTDKSKVFQVHTKSLQINKQTIITILSIHFNICYFIALCPGCFWSFGANSICHLINAWLNFIINLNPIPRGVLHPTIILFTVVCLIYVDGEGQNFKIVAVRQVLVGEGCWSKPQLELPTPAASLAADSGWDIEAN